MEHLPGNKYKGHFGALCFFVAGMASPARRPQRTQSLAMQDIPPNYATLFVATCNLLNLANPHRVYYENQDAYDEREYERKIA